MATALKAPPRRKAPPDLNSAARARLRAALKPDVNFRRVGRDARILVRLVPLAALPLGGAMLLALHVPALPADFADWRAWVDPAAFVLIALLITIIFAAGVSRTMRAFERSAPDSPEAALHEFMRVATARRPRARRLGRLVSGFVEPQPAPRPVLNWMTATAFDRVDSARQLARYWRALLRGNPAVVRRARLAAIKVENPRADVAIARVTLKVSATRRISALLTAGAGLMVAAAPLIVGPARLAEFAVPFWGAVIAAGAIGLLLSWALRRLNRTVIQQQETTVHKILVRNAQNWRLLSGEWESADEADASWLLTA